MLMKAMVTTSTLKDLLDDTHPDELSKVLLATNGNGAKIPLVTATVSPRRFAAIAKKTLAEIVSEPDCFPAFEHAIFVTAHSEPPEYEADNSTGLLGVWQKGGDEV